MKKFKGRLESPNTFEGDLENQQGGYTYQNVWDERQRRAMIVYRGWGVRTLNA